MAVVAGVGGRCRDTVGTACGGRVAGEHVSRGGHAPGVDQAEAAEEAEKGAGASEAEQEKWLEGLARPASDPPASDVTAQKGGPSGASVSPETTSPAPVSHLVSVCRRGWMILSQALGAGRLIGVSWHPEPLMKPIVAQAGFS